MLADGEDVVAGGDVLGEDFLHVGHSHSTTTTALSSVRAGLRPSNTPAMTSGVCRVSPASWCEVPLGRQAVRVDDEQNIRRRSAR